MADESSGQRQRERGTAARRRIDRLTSGLVGQFADHPDAQSYVRSEWRERVLRAHVVSRRAQEAFYLGRWLVVAGSTIVPTLVTLGVRSHGAAGTAAQIAAVVLSLLVAIAAAALQVTRMGQRWRQFHQRQVDLEHAGWQLFAKRGKYVGLDVNQRFAVFVDQVESIVLAYERAYETEIARLDQDEGGSGIANGDSDVGQGPSD